MNTTAVKMTHIFISFLGALRALEEGRVDAKDLRYGLFYFGCSEEYAYNQKAQQGWVIEKIYWILVTALKYAEGEGRVQWRKPQLQQKGDNPHAITIGLRENTYGELNELMVRNDLQPMRYLPGDVYSFEGVEERLRSANSQLAVIH